MTLDTENLVQDEVADFRFSALQMEELKKCTGEINLLIELCWRGSITRAEIHSRLRLAIEKLNKITSGI